MTLFALGLSYKGELLLAFEFAVFSGRFKFFVSSRDHHFMTSSQAPGIPDLGISKHDQYHRGRAHTLSLSSDGDNDASHYV